jgi:hypothetical protein
VVAVDTVALVEEPGLAVPASLFAVVPERKPVVAAAVAAVYTVDPAVPGVDTSAARVAVLAEDKSGAELGRDIVGMETAEVAVPAFGLNMNMTSVGAQIVVLAEVRHMIQAEHY